LPEPVDPFRVPDVGALQQRLLEFLAPERADISVQIAALRSAADLLNNAVSQAALAVSLRNLLGGAR